MKNDAPTKRLQKDKSKYRLAASPQFFFRVLGEDKTLSGMEV
nr:hypothetical protein [Sporomusa sphaeroides]